MILCLIISYYDEYEIDMTLITKNNVSSKSMNDYIRFAMLEWNISYSHTGFLLHRFLRFALSFFCDFYERSQVVRVTACVQCVHSVRSTTRN